MRKILVSYQNKINLLQILLFDKIYSLCGKNIKKNKKINILPENFISLTLDSEIQYNASVLTDEFLKKKFNLNFVNFFETENHSNIFYLDQKKSVAAEILKFLRVLTIAKKISNLNSDYKIYLYPEKMNLEVIFFLENKFNNTYVPKFIKLNFFFINFFKLVSSFFFILIMPELKMLLTLNKSNLKYRSKSFLIGYNIFPYQDFDKWPSNDFLLKYNYLSKNEVLYIFNTNFYRSISDIFRLKIWKNNLINKDYNFFSLSDSSSFISFKDYIKFIYSDASNLRFFLLKNFFLFRFSSIKCLDMLYLYINWKIFFRFFKIKNFLSSMVFGENITNYLNQKNSINTSFLYFSTSAVQHFQNKLLENFSDFHQYSFSFYDNFIGSKISYQQFYYNLQNTFKNYLEVGSISSYKILKSRKSKILAKLKFHKEKKIICFFDTAIGYGGHVEPDAYYEFLDFIDKFSNLNQNFFIILKIKTSFKDLLRRSNNKIFIKMQRLKINKNFIVFDDYTIAKLNIDVFDLIAVSDVAIHLPVSSLIFDGLCANKITLVYDPSGNYKNKNFFYSDYKDLYFSNKFLLKKRITSILNSQHQIPFKFVSKFVKSKINKFCDDKSIKRLTNYFYEKNN
jgi:hypothetical protein